MMIKDGDIPIPKACSLFYEDLPTEADEEYNVT
jgi:hypothetical protein